MTPTDVRFMSKVDPCAIRLLVILGHAGAFTISESFGYVSHFVVHPSYRKQGLGSALLKQSLTQLKPRNTVLHASATAEYYYQKRGFHDTNTYVTLCRLSTAQCARVSVKSNVSVRCVNGEEDVAKVLEYDRTIHPTDRGSVMASWIQSGLTVIACDDEGDVVGYVTAKMTYGSTILSPWYADTRDIALILLKNITQRLQHDYHEVWVYIFSENKHVLSMVQPFLVGSEPLESCPMLTTADMDTSRICWDRLYGFCLASSIV